MSVIVMGPVLSFRGLAGAYRDQWRVTALIAVGVQAQEPELYVDDDTSRGEPVELARNASIKLLRYDLSVTLADAERRVRYGFGSRQRWQFIVPARELAPRIAYVSCNGFSDPDAVRKLKTPLNAVWDDLLCNHDAAFRPDDYAPDKEQRWHEERIHGKGLQRFHLLAMGGDQIYFDTIWQERETLRELCDWTELPLAEQIRYQPSEQLKRGIADYYFRLYLERWAARNDEAWGTPQSHHRGAAAAMAAIPTVMMWDDHDIFDGWGSYPPELQYCPLFRHMFAEARRAFWIFQLQQREADLPLLTDNAANAKRAPDAPACVPVNWAAVREADSLTLPFFDGQPGFSHAHQLGPVTLLVPDLRTERSQTQILGEASWEAFLRRLNAGTASEEHLLVMSSIPVAHPKLGAAEWATSHFGSPDVKNGIGDDLNDHWSHRLHEGERKRLVRALIAAASKHRTRVTLLSGDVHVAAWGTLLRKDASPADNWMRINQLTSSAVMHPPPAGFMESLFLAYLNNAARTPQTIDSEHAIEMMRFPASDQYIHAARNWLALELDRDNFSDSGKHRLWATWRCEGDDRFSNHLLAIHPVRMAPASSQPEPVMAGHHARAITTA
jgi:hypothetical protein